MEIIAARISRSASQTGVRGYLEKISLEESTACLCSTPANVELPWSEGVISRFDDQSSKLLWGVRIMDSHDPWLCSVETANGSRTRGTLGTS